jgi:hypothetical protein
VGYILPVNDNHRVHLNSAETTLLIRGMPGGGELALVAYGNQNTTFNGNPEFTNFYKIFKRYTHFSQESITIPMDGPNEMMLDAPIRIRAKIPRHADLLTDLTFVFRIPEIYSKIQVLNDNRQRVPAFRWIHMLGPLIIDNIGIYVGGTKVQEFPGEWIAARAAADLPADQYQKWRTLVGDVPELTEPEWGVYGHAASYPFQKGEYPNTVLDPSGAATAPSIPARTIRVPLPFWFSETAGRALPLIALQLHEVEVQITLRTLREIYRIMDASFQREPNRYGRTVVLDPTKPTSYDPITPTTFDNLTYQNKYEAYDDPQGSLRHFFTDAGQPIPAQDGFIMNAHLEGNYVYLTEREQAVFAARELWALVHQVQTFRFPSIVSRKKLDLDAHGVTHRVLFYARRSDAIEFRNDYTNLSNWKSLGQAPYWPITGAPTPNSGLLIPDSQRDILLSARLVCAGNEMFEEKPADYYEVQTPYYTAIGGGTTGLTAGSSVRPPDIFGPIYHMPFALRSSDHEQPSGSLNMSRLREIQLEVQTAPLDPDAPYTYDFTVFVESMNAIKYLNGMAGLAFAV